MTLPLFPEIGHVAEVRKPRLAGWWTKAPGWYKQEARQALKRLTDHQFLARVCHHRGGDSLCKGHNRDWSQPT